MTEQQKPTENPAPPQTETDRFIADVNAELANQSDSRPVGAGTESNRAIPEPVAGDRAADRPVAEAAGTQEAHADAGREGAVRHRADAPSPAVNPVRTGQGLSRARDYDPYNLDRRRLGPVHGATHRVRQDVDLDPADVVEQTIRTGSPSGGWIDIEAHGGGDALRELREMIGASSKGINLVATPGEYVDPMLIRELRAGSIPARLVRRPRGG
jgi:hypothetical protein